MPTYDYVCEACDHEFEEFQSMSAKVLKKCPECGKNKLKRLIGTGAGVIFKGSGFYETDYRSDSYNKAAKADKPASDSGSSDSKSSDSSSTKSDSSAKSDSSSSPKSESSSKKSDAKPASKPAAKASKKD